MRPQVAALVLNANGDPGALRRLRPAGGRRQRPGFRRPAGRHSRRARLGGGAPAGLPDDRQRRRPTRRFCRAIWSRGCCAAREADGADLACAASDGQPHPVFGLWPVRLREALRAALVDEGIRKVDVWTGRYRLATVDFPIEPVDPFFNANRPEDLETAEALLTGD